MTVETPKTEKQREKRLKQTKEQNIQGLWDNNKRCYVCVMGILEGKERNRSNI